ncbi:SpaA isopeptide-forming pilin-related protein [Bacillus norwichensis]|uniref:MucBP domain-containing protein n=1 Tax=Bacillus norwichensis TaxID=2762217 RepID=A0ABR8VRD2_9BACI|nr:SpaA isopeptide-forming pilin-related protein [Bacillus norwichensis]MBD8007106.1 MucBP domain-containing protein [Bacillus norwichensis]
MSTFRRLSVVISILLVLQLLVPISTTFAETSEEDSDGRIKVENIDQSQESIKWLVTINASGTENDGISTKINLSAGLSHGTITEMKNAKIEKTDKGYDIQTPAGKETYEFEVEAGISDPNQSAYELATISEYSDGKFDALSRTVPKKEPAPEESKNAGKKEEPESVKEKETDAEKEKAGEETPLEKDLEASSENEESDSEEVDSEEINGQPHPPFLTTSRPNALKGVRSGPNWPDPGSLKLTKDGTPTGKYAEWEVELTIQGKNLKTSSDIVIVFDKSGSMSTGQRLSKAKAAANEFVDQLLIEGSSTRIALVSFSTESSRDQDFTGYSNKQQLKNRINMIPANGGTNIQAGLHQAQTLLAGSNADLKTIVLLSDGEPTYSFSARNAEAYTWPGNKYNFILSNFNYNNRIGPGNNYNLNSNQRYTVNGYNVRTNGIATISEARHAMNSGIGIYSVGLEVGNNVDARYVLENSQNKGNYLGGQDDLSRIFEEIAASLNYAATDAVVTDPMGEMFNLVKDESYNGQNFEASHGTVTWDDATETFTWNVGAIKENEVYTLKYKVTIDWDKNPQGNVSYPMNGDTPLDYKDPKGNPSTKPFPIPEGAIEKGKIIKIGYRVNTNGEPVDSNGNVVSSPAEAEQFYEEFHQENNSEDLLFNKTYSVTANDVPDYTLIVGENPTDIALKPEQPLQTVWFGYVKTEDLVAGDVTAKYVDENGDEIAQSEVFTGKVGDTYTTKQKDIQGYEFVKVDEDGAPATGKFKKDPQTVIYIYKKKLGSLTVIKVDEKGAPLAGAEFELRNKNGDSVGAAQTTDETGKVIFENLDWGEYKLVETKAPEGYRLLSKPIDVKITANELNVEKKVENSKSGWGLPDTGGMGTTLFYALGAILMIISLVFLLRKKRTRESTQD